MCGMCGISLMSLYCLHTVFPSPVCVLHTLHTTVRREGAHDAETEQWGGLNGRSAVPSSTRWGDYPDEEGAELKSGLPDVSDHRASTVTISSLCMQKA
jgi:hypothetical protein